MPMTETRLQDALAVNVQDVTGHKTVRVAGISRDMTVAELVRGLVPKMELPSSDPEGRGVSYHVRSDRLGRHLHASELLDGVLETDDTLVLQPNIQAG